MSTEKILKTLEEKKFKFVDLRFCDTMGKEQHVSLPVSAVDAAQDIVTIEGLSADNDHPLQQAWAELDVPQCGYCQPGMIMASVALLRENPSPTDADIDAAITNICRCGTYNRVRQAIHAAAKKREGDDA